MRDMPGNSTPIRVVLIDPSEISRIGCRTLFEADPRFEVVGDITFAEASRFEDCRVDLVIIAPALEDEVDFDSLPVVLDAFRDASFLLLTDSSDPEYMKEALRFGVRGFVGKSRSTGSVLLDAACLVASRVTAVADLVLLESLTAGGSNGSPRWDLVVAPTPLTSREVAILRLLAQGSSDGEIAHLLGVASTTIQTHVGNILRKANVTTRVQLGVYALAAGIVEWDPAPQPSLAAS